jgi:hypothetical protein
LSGFAAGGFAAGAVGAEEGATAAGGGVGAGIAAGGAIGLGGAARSPRAMGAVSCMLGARSMPPGNLSDWAKASPGMAAATMAANPPIQILSRPIMPPVSS